MRKGEKRREEERRGENRREQKRKEEELLVRMEVWNVRSRSTILFLFLQY